MAGGLTQKPSFRVADSSAFRQLWACYSYSNLQMPLYTHKIKNWRLLILYLRPVNLTPTCFSNLCISPHTCIPPPCKCMAPLIFLEMLFTWLLLMQCSCCAFCPTLLPLPPFILHFHCLNPTLISRVISEDFNISTPPRLIPCPTVAVFLYVVCLLLLYRMSCLQGRTT